MLRILIYICFLITFPIQLLLFRLMFATSLIDSLAYMSRHVCTPTWVCPKKKTNKLHFWDTPMIANFLVIPLSKKSWWVICTPTIFVCLDYPPWFLWCWDKPFEPNVSIICRGRWPHHRLFWLKHPQSWYGFWWGKPHPRSRSGFNCCNYQDQHSWLIFSDIPSGKRLHNYGKSPCY